MEKIIAGDPETQSADIISENLAQLQSLFPEAFTEGKVDFEVLKGLLGGAVEERESDINLFSWSLCLWDHSARPVCIACTFSRN